MGATQNFNEPAWASSIDDSLDSIRDNYHFLLCVAATGSIVLPGWQTTVTATDYSEPDTITLTRGTKRIIINYTWNADSSVNTIQVCYDDGVSSPGLVCFQEREINYDQDGNFTGGDAPVDLLTGLVAWWDLDEASSYRYDSHGSQDLSDGSTISNATDNGITAANFENNDVMTDNDMVSLGSGGGSFTIAGLIRPDTSGTLKCIAAAHNGTFSESGADYRLYITNNRLYMEASNGTSWYNVYKDITVGNWYLFVAGFDNDTKKVWISLDGGEATDGLGTLSGSVNTAATKFWLGRWNTTAFSYDGLAARFGFWSRRLDSNEITRLYNGGSYLEYTDL